MKGDPMTEISIVDLRKQLAETVNTVNYLGERVVLTKHNKPVAAIVPMDDLKLLDAFEDRLDMTEATEILAEGEFLNWEDVKAKL